MVFLALTPGGLLEALALAGTTSPVWCCASAISEAEFSANPSPNLTRFAYTIVGGVASPEMIGALSTIEEHHPNERIWVECTSAA